ncbi:hypothetical protein Tco_1434402 [Tanacetum coccineum]
MGEPTIGEYMTKTREDYGLGIARPKFDEKARSSDTSDGLAAIQAQLNNLGREIKKVNEKVAAALGFYQRDSGNPLYQERRKIMEESLSKFMAESAKRHDENSNLIKEIRASTDAAIRN